MSFNHPKAGPNLVGAYQMSGIPFVTSSVANEVPGPDDDSSCLPIKVSFPYVTKFITVRNTGINDLRIGFSANGVVDPTNAEFLATVAVAKPTSETRNYFILPHSGSGASSGFTGQLNAETTQTFEVRCKEVFFLSNATAANSPGNAQASSFSLIAGLTPILASEFPILSASFGFTGAG